MTSNHRKANRFWGDNAVPKSKLDFFNAVTSPAPSGSGNLATIRLYGPIDSWGGYWGISAKDVGQVLDSLPDEITQIILRVNSPGGEVFEGISILNLLRAHKASITAVVDGLAASAASVIVAGFEDVVMSPGTQMMIHSPSSIVWGPASEMRKSADVLDGVEASLIEIYTAKAGEKDWATLLAEETWLTAAGAVEIGLADRVAVIPDAGEAETVGLEELEDPFAGDDEIEDWTSRLHGAQTSARIAARAPKLPSSSEPGEPNQKENVVSYDNLRAGLRERLGVPDAAVSDEQILAAVDEALAEGTSETITPPAGTTLIDTAVLADLRAAGEDGRAARAQQASDRREAIVNTAVQEGRIAPASRATWLEQLEANETGAAALLATLPANKIAVAELGKSDEPTTADNLYATAWPDKEAK